MPAFGINCWPIGEDRTANHRAEDYPAQELCLSNAINRQRVVMQHRILLRLAVIRRDPFECIPQDGVGTGDPVHGEVALEHAALRAELIDTEMEPGAESSGQFLRAGWELPVRPAETVDGHGQAAELDPDVGAGGDLANPRLPVRENCFASTRERPDTQRAAELTR